jgi:hypothetical protein
MPRTVAREGGPVTTPADEDEFTELIDFRPDRVDLVGKGANGIPRFLIAKQDGAAGLLDPGFVRELIAKSGDGHARERVDMPNGITINGTPAAIAELIHKAALASREQADPQAAAVPKALAEYEQVVKAKYNAADLKRMAASGAAMKDGCLSAETLVATRRGPQRIDSLVGECELITDAGWAPAEVRSFGIKPLLAVTLHRGARSEVVHVTAGHRWLLAGGQWKLTRDLIPGDRILHVEVLGERSQPGRLDTAEGGVAAGSHTPDLIQSRTWEVAGVTETPRVEEVFCAIVPDLHRFALASGALTGNSYPIGDADDLGNAVHAVGRGGDGHDAIRRHVITRAKALGKSSEIPDSWAADGSLKQKVSKDMAGMGPDLDDGADGMDPTVPLAEPAEMAPGDPAEPGSPAWESIDAATAQKWTSIAARLSNVLCVLAEREMLEAASADPDDAENAFDLEDAKCAVEYAIERLAVYAAGEQAEADLGTEMEAIGKALAAVEVSPLETLEGLAAVRKSGRVLSAANENRIREAASSLQDVLSSLPSAPQAAEPVAKEAAMPDSTTTEPPAPVTDA